MKLEYLFTVSRKNKIGSRIIAKSTKNIHPELKECSHVVIKMGPIIFESTIGKGVTIIPYKNWIKEHRVVYAFQCATDRKAKDVINNVISKFYGKKYDWNGIAYFSWRVLLFLLFGSKIPKKNKWEQKNKFFCVELIESITGEKYSMTSPIQLVKILKSHGLVELDVSNYDNLYN